MLQQKNEAPLALSLVEMVQFSLSSWISMEDKREVEGVETYQRMIGKVEPRDDVQEKSCIPTVPCSDALHVW